MTDSGSCEPPCRADRAGNPTDQRRLDASRTTFVLGGPALIVAYRPTHKPSSRASHVRCEAAPWRPRTSRRPMHQLAMSSSVRTLRVTSSATDSVHCVFGLLIRWVFVAHEGALPDLEGKRRLASGDGILDSIPEGGVRSVDLYVLGLCIAGRSSRCSSSSLLGTMICSTAIRSPRRPVQSRVPCRRF